MMARMIKVRFRRNKYIKDAAGISQDVGPDYPVQIVMLEEREAYRYLVTGAAVVHEDELAPVPPAPTLSAAAVFARPAAAEHRDPVPAAEAKPAAEKPRAKKGK
jgi:hypothetical protein